MAKVVGSSPTVPTKLFKEDNMEYCVSCGRPVREGQSTCPMCYGDAFMERNRYENEDFYREAQWEQWEMRDEPEQG